MRSSFPIGRVLGIPIRVHVSWFLVLALVSAAQGWQFAAQGAAAPAAALAGLVAALLLFASVLLHELGHSVLARAFGIHVRRIQLFLFGGVAEILGEPRGVLDEILIAAAGPAVSVGLAVLLAAPAWLAPAGLAQAILRFLFFANLLLFLFNMLPAFPSDGGRIVRAILWGISGDFRRATRWAAGLGIGIASLLVAGGAALAITASARDNVDLVGSRLGGAWMAMIGFYLVRSARAGVTQARVSEAIRAAKVGDVMLAVRPLVPGEKTLFQVFTDLGGPSAAEMFLGFPVSSAGACIGYVEPDDLLRVPREEWHTVTASQVMKPIAAVPRLDVAEPLDRLVRAIVADGAAGGLVFSGGALVGYASRADVARFLVEAREDGGGVEPPAPGPGER